MHKNALMFLMLRRQSDGNLHSDLIKMFINMLFHIKRFKNIVINNIALLGSNNAIADILHKKLFNCIVAHTGCHNAILNGGRTAALNMTENAGA